MDFETFYEDYCQLKTFQHAEYFDLFELGKTYFYYTPLPRKSRYDEVTNKRR
jgi:hypothetical protein